jgi:hypothetical protein
MRNRNRRRSRYRVDATMGVHAVAFAFEHAARLAANNELETAELWRHIAMATAELAARRPR